MTLGQFTSVHRYELKHVLRPDVAKRVARFLNAHLQLDEHCGARDGNTYTVRSIYFDSPHFRCFHEKMAGNRYREKFRIRTYNHSDSAPLFLEHKRKSGLFYVKEKLPLSSEFLDQIGRCDRDTLAALDRSDRRLVEKLLFHMHRDAFSPVLLAAYEREAYVDSVDETIRATLDGNLRAMMFPALGQIHDETGLEFVLHDATILEIKFSHVLPRWIGSLRACFDLQAQACSKYCTSTAHFLGEIPVFKDGMAYV